MSIRQKLLAVFLLTIVVVLAIGTYAQIIYQTDLEEEQHIESQIIEAIELAYRANSYFHIEVNSWKNILLRGNTGNNYHKYLSEFYRNDRKTRKTIQHLHNLISSHPTLSFISEELVESHQKMGHKLREGVKVFNTTDANASQVTDKYVEGIEDIPSQILQKLTGKLIEFRQKQEQEFKDKRQTQQLQLAVTVLISISIFIGIFLWIVDSNIARPAQRASFLSEVIEHAQTAARFGIWDWDIENQRHFWSANLYTVLGLDTATKPSFENFINCLRDSERENIRNIIQAAIQSGKSFEFESESNSANEEKSYFYVKGDLTKSTKNAVNRMTCVVHDISDVKKIHNRFVKSDTMFRSVFNAAGDAIIIFKDGELIDCNPQALKIFNCSREQILGKTPEDLSPDMQPGGLPSRAVASEIFNTLNSTQSTQVFSWKFVRHDYTPFMAEVSLTTVELDGISCVQGIIRDVTLRRRTEDALKKAVPV